MYDNIPHEMRTFKQWCCWQLVPTDSGKPTKLPYDPKQNKLASVTDPSTWGTFEQAVAAKNFYNYSGIGFVLTRNDPYAFIDLDDTNGDSEALQRQQLIFNEFDSYAERSPSGRGLHIIIRASLPSGRKRSYVELYSADRYMTMTGDVYRDAPINPHQEKASLLWEQMKGSVNNQLYDGTAAVKEDDAIVIQRAHFAANGEKFGKLYAGDWQSYYSSQSEADFALVDMVAFYTQNKEQIVRIFRSSGLGKRDKAQRDQYIEYMLNKCFDRMLPPIDFEGVKEIGEQLKAAQNARQNEVISKPVSEFQGEAFAAIPTDKNSVEVPPGLMGEIAQFIYRSSTRPVPEIAVVAAIGLMAGICGRSYNISATGLNQYILLLANTGTGKEGISSGINRLMNEVIQTVPAAAEFRGPGHIASGQALLKNLSNAPSQVAIVGEFGLKMQQLAHPRASSADIALKSVLLDLFNKSGNKDILPKSVYADKANNTEIIKSPAFTLLGESTPETFYSSLDESLIADGLLPRFTIIEYTGKRPQRNPTHDQVDPPLDLVKRFSELCACSLQLNSQNHVIHVQQTDEAKSFLDAVDHDADEKINAADNEVLRQLWNRTHMKTLKLAALVAVGVNFVNPVITIDIAKWAYGIIRRDVDTILSKFKTGIVGRDSGESVQITTIMKAIMEYITKPYSAVASYKVPSNLHQDKLIPQVYLQRKLMCIKCFKEDKMGATNSIKRAITMLLDDGTIREIGKKEIHERYGEGGKAYAILNAQRFS